MRNIIMEGDLNWDKWEKWVSLIVEYEMKIKLDLDCKNKIGLKKRFGREKRVKNIFEWWKERLFGLKLQRMCGPDISLC